MEASQEKRDKYEEAIKGIEKEQLVYVDESGIEMTICKDRGWGKKSEKLIAQKSGKHYERTNIGSVEFSKNAIFCKKFIAQSCSKDHS